MAKAYAVSTGPSSMAQTFSVPRLSATSLYGRFPALPYLFPRSASSSTSASASASFKHSSGFNSLAPFQIKASFSEEPSGSGEVGEVFSDLKEKWDAIENKSMIILYGGGAIVALWLSSIVVDAINSVPLSSRKELAAEIDALKKKIAGSE